MTASVAQTAAVTFASSQSSVPTGNITTTTGHGLLYVIATRNAATSVSGVADGAGNTWAVIRREALASGVTLEIWGTTNANPTGLVAQQITATLSLPDSVVARWFEIAGGNPANQVDVQQGADALSSTGMASGSTTALAVANELALGVVAWGGGHTITAPAFTQATESTAYPSSTGFDDSTGVNGQANLHCGTLIITTTTGQAYSSTLNTAAPWSAFVMALNNVPPNPPPVPPTVTRPRIASVRSHGETTGGAPILGESTYRAQLLIVKTGTEITVASRSRITRSVVPPVATPPSIFKVKAPKASVIAQVRSVARVTRGPTVIAAVPKVIVRALIVKPAVIAVRAATARITRGLRVQAGQSTFTAKPTVTRPRVQFVRSLTKTLLQPFGPISPPYVPPAGGDGWGDDWDTWNINNPSDPNFGDGWE